MGDQQRIAKCAHLRAWETHEPVDLNGPTFAVDGVLKSQRVGISTLLVEPNSRRDGVRYEVDVCVICAAWLCQRLDSVIDGREGLVERVGEEGDHEPRKDVRP